MKGPSVNDPAPKRDAVSPPARRSVLLALGASLGLLAAGCVAYPRGSVSYAPVHGYRWYHPDGYWLAYDSALGVYVVVGWPYYYYWDGFFFHYYRGRWLRSGHLRGRPWHTWSYTRLPPGLRRYRTAPPWREPPRRRQPPSRQRESRPPGPEPRRRSSEPRRPGPEPRRPGFEPRRPGFEPRRPGFEPRRPDFEPRRPGFEPRGTPQPFEPRGRPAPEPGPRQRIGAPRPAPHTAEPRGGSGRPPGPAPRPQPRLAEPRRPTPQPRGRPTPQRIEPRGGARDTGPAPESRGKERFEPRDRPDFEPGRGRERVR